MIRVHGSNRLRFKAYRLGFADGIRSPYDLASGLTWSEVTPGHDYSEAYDRGVNAGQIVGAAIRFKPTQAQPFTGKFFNVRGILP